MRSASYIFISIKSNKSMSTTYKTVYYVTTIRVVSRVRSLPPNEVHDFVLSFSGNACIRNNYLKLEQCQFEFHVSKIQTNAYIFPTRIGVHFARYPISQ